MNQLLPDMAELHRQDLLADAAHERLMSEHYPSQPQQRAHAVALAWMGEQFIAWGWRLRARYGNVERRAAL